MPAFPVAQLPFGGAAAVLLRDDPVVLGAEAALERAPPAGHDGRGDQRHDHQHDENHNDYLRGRHGSSFATWYSLRALAANPDPAHFPGRFPHPSMVRPTG
ncbi:hypothetical protein [Micromonospora sp. 4G55]|uniref:hypothetical protein n=1 Tax=Micromonospora sp. 4G55 TaxID=2806102 RepID=UPI0035C734B9